MDTVVSPDGTAIAYERAGSGPPLVLIHGTGRDHSQWMRSLPELARQATVYAIDRRGRGQSGDTDRYAIDRDVEDVLALIGAIGQPVYLLGHSYAAIVAMEAALRTEWTDRLGGLVLYEPPLSVGPGRGPSPLGDKLEALMATGDREAVLVTFLQEGPRYPPEVIAAQQARPDWSYRLTFAHTLPREAQALERYVFEPGRLANLRVPTLLLLGSQSPPFFRQAIEALDTALPDSEVVVLKDQHHNAMEAAPALFADQVHRFIRDHPHGTDRQVHEQTPGQADPPVTR